MTERERVIVDYSDMVYRIAMLRLGDRTSADDAYQNTFLAWLDSAPDFADSSHEKAWFIRTAINAATDILRDRCRRRVTSLDDCLVSSDAPEYTGVFDALRNLPDKYATPLYLHYVEGYSTDEIARLLRLTGSGARMRLKRGRELLYDAYMKPTDHHSQSERRESHNEENKTDNIRRYQSC